MDASVYSEAKGEYTKQLTLFIVPAFHKFFIELLQQAAEEEPQAKRQLWKFQEKLSQIPEWNMDKVQKEINRMIAEIQCDYLEELLTAVFIAHTKVLTAIRIGNKNKRVQITIPKLDHFLHRALSESSRLLWSSAFLFHSEISAIEKQKNHRQIEQLLHEGVAQAIRGLLPVKNILKDYIAEPEADTDADDEGDDDAEHTAPEKPAEITVAEKVEEKIAENTVAENTVAENTVAENTVAENIVPDISENTVINENTATEKIPENSADNQPELPINDEIRPIEPIKLTEIQQSSASSPTTPAIIKLDEPIAPAKPETPTLIVATEPTVRFTDFDQVIQQRGAKTHIDYVEKDREEIEDEEFHFMDDEGTALSDFEELNEEAEKLSDSDFETI
jgi:hypothetical protein